MIIASTRANVYGTRQSNLGAGGAAIYGCRTTADFNALADTTKSTPCLRVNNLRNGLIHSYRFGTGSVGGVYQAGATDDNDPTARPFITNATGVATGLNADRVDGHARRRHHRRGPRQPRRTGRPKGDTGAPGDQGPRGRGRPRLEVVQRHVGAASRQPRRLRVGDFYINIQPSGAAKGDVYEKTGDHDVGRARQPRRRDAAGRPPARRSTTAVAAYCSPSRPLRQRRSGRLGCGR